VKLVKFLKTLVTLCVCSQGENRFFINLFKITPLALLEYIKDQLLFNETVTLPGFGSFEIRKSVSRIEGKKIIPPGIQIVFNPDKSLDDGLLTKNIAAAEDISIEDSRQKVLEYIDEILFALNKGEEYTFYGFGKLFRDTENVFRFEKDPDFKLGFESYGLESFELDSVDELTAEEELSEEVVAQQEDIETETVEEATASEQEPESIKKSEEKIGQPSTEAEEKQILSETAAFVSQGATSRPADNKNNRSIFWILTGAVMIILVSFVLIRMTTDLLDRPGGSFFKQGSGDESELFPEEEDWDLESTLSGDLGKAIDSMTFQENALTINEDSEPMQNAEAIPSDYKEFHIIAGSFKDKINAGILQQSLTEQGYPALVIQQGDQLYRVSALSFSDKETGLQELTRFKQKTKNNAAWLLGLN